MSDSSQEDVISIVNSLFEVNQFTKTLYSLEFKIDDLNFKSKFEELARILEDMNYVCRLEKMNDGKYLIVQKFSRKPPRKWLSASWTPRILFAVVVTFVMIDGYFRTDLANSIVDIGNPYEMAGIYTLALLGILGIHESGHLIAAFGAFIQSRGLTINREILFDVAIAGPIAGLIIAIVVSLFGAYTAPVLEVDVVQGLYEDSRLIKWELGEPLLMTASLSLFGKGGDGQEVLMTPLLFAAWIGFLITFLNLLPAWQLDGGHLARTLVGSKIHRYATYGSMAILVLLDFWLMAILILVLSSRNPSANPLDDISKLSKNRKLAYAGVVVLAILCAPLPSGLLPW
jgi:membrane-associated protease RseP (regulator of RpoE activity)